MESSSQACAVQRALRGETCRDRIRRDRKRAECTIAGRFDEIAAVRLDRVAQDRIVLRERPLHRRVLRLPQPRAALDVGEQERDRAGRQRAVSGRQRRHGEGGLNDSSHILRVACRLRNLADERRTFSFFVIFCVYRPTCAAPNARVLYSCPQLSRPEILFRIHKSTSQRETDMHPSLLRIAFALALAAAMAAPVFGQSIVVPNGNANVTGNDTSGPLPGGVSFRSRR